MTLEEELAYSGRRATLEKYEPLRDHLVEYGAGDQLRLSFSEIEELVGPLPRGARRLRHWWTNDSKVLQAQAWRAAGWRVLLVDMGSEQVLFERHPAGHAESAIASPATASRWSFRDYVAEIHLPLVVVLVILSAIIGGIGFALRPGTDEPPTVSSPAITLYIFQQGSAAAPFIDPTRVSVDEIMMQETSSTVLLQLDLFAAFAASGVVHWQLGTTVSLSQPYPCPDLYDYLGTAQPDPVIIQNAELTIGGHTATPAVSANFVGHRSARTASNVLGLYGQSPGVVRAGDIAPIGEVDLCWKSEFPMAFDGEFASASLSAVTAVSQTSGNSLPLDLSRTLYFENIHQNPQPITAEYSLQAGTLPTSTDPYGWNWSGSQGGSSVQVTTIDIPASQHEAYLGFLSGVLFGVVGGAVVLILQEILEPIRLRRRAQTSASTKRGNGR